MNQFLVSRETKMLKEKVESTFATVYYSTYDARDRESEIIKVLLKTFEEK